jgi:hypothetical protein
MDAQLYAEILGDDFIKTLKGPVWLPKFSHLNIQKIPYSLAKWSSENVGLWPPHSTTKIPTSLRHLPYALAILCFIACPSLSLAESVDNDGSTHSDDIMDDVSSDILYERRRR